ncbi:hypothetical protein SAMN05661010_01416 [Modicisalibacter muralis]|uniref:Uncharacterized protein n=1 Tax=Modicisalibacter muralis TaxID=119000 RepID=A0A1G9J1Q2_9GAMM|nr:hypothetical protein [Halomonas muralis]SDL31074.1 hypothetical protein SAMN05661010_01416 [Halomonas muralis]
MFKAISFAACLLATSVAFAHDESKLEQMPPEGPYVQVSDVLPLPAFLPGLGTLFVNPDTLPAGPFLGYDHDGKLSATIYMTPLEELKNGVTYDDLGVGLHKVTSVDVYYNAGHPGVDKPHAHIVLYHDAGAEERLAK